MAKRRTVQIGKKKSYWDETITTTKREYVLESATTFLTFNVILFAVTFFCLILGFFIGYTAGYQICVHEFIDAALEIVADVI